MCVCICSRRHPQTCTDPGDEGNEEEEDDDEGKGKSHVRERFRPPGDRAIIVHPLSFSLTHLHSPQKETMRMEDQYLTLSQRKMMQTDSANSFSSFLMWRESSFLLIGSYFCVHVFWLAFALLSHLNEHHLLSLFSSSSRSFICFISFRSLSSCLNLNHEQRAKEAKEE